MTPTEIPRTRGLPGRIGVGSLLAVIGCGAGETPGAAGSSGGTTSSVDGGGGVSATDGTTSSCKVVETLCGAVCTDLNVDNANCGSCGTPCPADQTCVEGLCGCATGSMDCGAGCRDILQDPANCGACGTQCLSGELCEAGTCGCQPGLTQCAGLCVSLQSDANNCGACGVVCGTETVCSAGACSQTCVAGTTQCDSSCADLASDPLNCGACGVVCPAGESCAGGSCTCPQGQTACDGACVDLMTSLQHCGACGAACATGQTCQGGTCACADGEQLCDGVCSDVSTDAENCGACGVTCAAGQSCSAGDCVGSGTGGAGTGGAASGATGGVGAGGAATGGVEATGGTEETGGTEAAGGAGATGGISGDDRCDVGVYDPNNPPQVLSIGNSPGSHDPAAIEADGTYHLFSTSMFAWTSTNLTSWQSASRAFGIPSWASSAVSGVSDLWAPDVSYFGGLYHIYYSASTFGSNRSCIGHATRASLSSGSWTDQGSPAICSNVSADEAHSNVNWNAIDPNVVIDTSGTPWMDFGSFWSGIQLIQLDMDGHRVGDTVTNIANRGGPGIEGPAIARRCSYYYLFTSWDTCCNGASSTYNIRVVRSENVDGPYVDQAGTPALDGGGTLIAEGDGSSWAGPGGQSVLFTSDNKAYLVYHAYAIPGGAHHLRLAELVWDSDGWPVPVGP